MTAHRPSTSGARPAQVKAPDNAATPPAGEAQAAHRYRVLFEQNPVAIGAWSLVTGKIVAANTALSALFGYTSSELIGLAVTELLSPEERPRLRSRIAALESEPHAAALWMLRTKDGRDFCGEVSGGSVDLDGEPARMVEIRNVSDRARAEVALRREQELLAGILASSADGILTIDHEWRLSHVNVAGEQLFEPAVAPAEGKLIWDALPQLAGTHFETGLRQAMDSGVSVTMEAALATGGRWFQVRAFPWSGGLAVHFRDVSARRRRHEAIRELTAGLAQSTSAGFFDELVSRLSAALQADGVFVGEFDGQPPDVFRTIALFLDGAFREKIAYPLVNTPCSELLRHDTWTVLGDLQEKYPENPVVREWAVGSYLGVSLKTPDGATTGLIAAVYRGDMRDPDAAMEVLQLFALRAAAELERRHALQRLRDSEEHFKLLAQTTNDALWDWNFASGSVWWSDGFEKLFGYAQAEVGTNFASWADRVHPDDRDRVEKGLHATIESTRNHWEDEYRFRRKDGTYALVIDRGFVLRDASGRGVRMVGGMTDMTERLESSQRLRDQAELLDRASDGILVRDLGHRILYWNRGAERIYGWSPDQAVGRTAHELLHADRAEFERATAQVVARGEWSGEIRHRDARKRELVLHSRWTLLRTPAGEPRAILAIDTDVTEKKRLETQFLRAQRLESIGVLAGGIAHDLNNMLTPITMSVDMLKRLHPADEATALVEAIENSARRGADLVRQVLGFTRGVEGRRLDVNPNFLVRDIAKIARETFPKNIRILTELPLEPWLVPGDPTQLHQVLLNLCVNARDAMPAGGEITIAVENMPVDAHYAGMHENAEAGNYVAISVADTGTGIPEEIREKIFDPFFTTKEPGKGTGLGLATVLGIVKGHDGWINLYSEVGQGTTFRVYLPAAVGAAVHVAEDAETNLPRGRGECVLVVDDEASIRSISKQTLETFGYSVLVATDGAEGLAVYVQNAGRVALVVTDMMMPVMDGPALIRALLRVDPAVRIIAASGLNAEGMVAKAIDAGARHFLPKPYTAETMLTTIAEVLRDAPAT